MFVFILILLFIADSNIGSCWSVVDPSIWVCLSYDSQFRQSISHLDLGYGCFIKFFTFLQSIDTYICSNGLLHITCIQCLFLE